MKQYLVMCDEVGMQRLKVTFPDLIQFVEVQGMTVKEPNPCIILTTPIQPQVPPLQVEEVKPSEVIQNG
jgi:hypothetical protein